jgi:hypothetical protein
VDPADHIWIADTEHDQVLKFSADGTLLRQVGSAGTGPGEFRRPLGIASDAVGNIYVADSLNSRVQKLSPSGVPIGQWGGQGTEPGQFAYPTGIDVGPTGDVYVTDRYNGRIQRFDDSGDLVQVFGQYAPEGGGDPLPAPIAVAADGSVFVEALLRYSDRFELAKFGVDGVLQETFGCPSFDNTGYVADGSELLVSHPGELGNVHEPPTGPVLERYGEGGARCDLPAPFEIAVVSPKRQSPRHLRVRIGCGDSACDATLTGSISSRPAKSTKRRTFAVRKARFSVPAGETQRVRLRVTRRHRLLRLAQMPHFAQHHWAARLSVFAATPSGAYPTSKEFRVRLK